MGNDVEAVNPVMIHIIVNDGPGSKILHMAKNNGVMGGTVFLGKGTIRHQFLESLGLDQEKKEIVLMVAGQTIANQVLDRIHREYKFEKPNHGIAYTTGITGLAGTSCLKCGKPKEKKGVEDPMYQEITVVVEKGRAEDVIDAAARAGSAGGTIINARGSGVHETSKLFAMDIEPEREIVIIISKAENTEKIVSSIREGLKLDEPGNGILFIQDIGTVYGLYK